MKHVHIQNVQFCYNMLTKSSPLFQEDHVCSKICTLLMCSLLKITNVHFIPKCAPPSEMRGFVPKCIRMLQAVQFCSKKSPLFQSLYFFKNPHIFPKCAVFSKMWSFLQNVQFCYKMCTKSSTLFQENHLCSKMCTLLMCTF